MSMGSEPKENNADIKRKKEDNPLNLNSNSVLAKFFTRESLFKDRY